MEKDADRTEANSSKLKLDAKEVIGPMEVKKVYVILFMLCIIGLMIICLMVYIFCFRKKDKKLKNRFNQKLDEFEDKQKTAESKEDKGNGSRRSQKRA